MFEEEEDEEPIAITEDSQWEVSDRESNCLVCGTATLTSL